MKKRTIMWFSLIALVLFIFILFINHEMKGCGLDPLLYYPETDLAKAVSACDDKKAEYLIKNGADINSREGDDTTPLHIIVLRINKPHDAFNTGCLNTFELLIKSGADVNVQDEDGRTPLHHTRDLLIIELLLKANADPNIKDNEGHTPIYHYINLDSEFYSKDKMELLLKHGARVDIKDKQGNTPLSVATGKSLELLKKYMKKQQSDTGEK